MTIWQPARAGVLKGRNLSVVERRDFGAAGGAVTYRIEGSDTVHGPVTLSVWASWVGDQAEEERVDG